MAKNKKSKRRPVAGSGGPAIADPYEQGDRRLVGSETTESGHAPATPPAAQSADDAEPASPRRAAAGFFKVYKPGQGYYTRMGTAIGAGLIIAYGAHYVYGRMSPEHIYLQMGIPFLFLVLGGLLLYWIVGSNPRTNEFFISTEGEMKKVAWSTRREVIGSTKVVLLFTAFLAGFLFVVDLLFMMFFSAIGVLKVDIGALLGFQ